MKTHLAPTRIPSHSPGFVNDARNAVEIPQPNVGQSITIARGPLAGVVATFSAYRGERWLVELPNYGPGVLAIVDPTICDPID
jgi:hypothetical protein